MMGSETKPTVFIPHPQHGHKGDSFRELAILWKEAGLVNLSYSPNRYCWWGNVGDVLLHDLPLCYDVVDDLPPYRLGLFGNEQETRRGGISKPWIFWPRNPRMIRDFLKDPKTNLKPPQFRYIDSAFVGKIENPVQAKRRFGARVDWSKAVEEFRVVKGVDAAYPYKPQDYIIMMSKTRFALCLPGYGPKCNREIEAVALGCIPVLTPGCDTTYHSSWVEGENYLFAKDDAEMRAISMDSTESDLNRIQNNNFKWYTENCSVEGSFNTTRKIIEESLS